MEARLGELEAEFNSSIIESGRKDLLFEYFGLRDELGRREAINRRIGFVLYFASGFMFCFAVFVEVFDMLVAAQKFP
jgi:hypothetical protein